MPFIYLKTNNLINNAFVKTLVYANVFVAVCSLAQVYFTTRLFNLPNDFKNNSYLLFILLSTFLQYNVQRGYMINPQNNFSERSLWLIKYKKPLLISVGLALVCVMFLCNNLSWTSIGIMIGAEVISTLYYLPPFNLRKHGYIKPFLISMIWVVSCCVVPLIENHLLSTSSIWFILSQFLFISVLCLLFDIKDMEHDYMSGINTYANKFGMNATKAICLTLIFISSVCFYQFKNELKDLLPFMIVLTLTALTVFYTTIKRNAIYYYLWVDGLLILQSVVYMTSQGG